MDGIISHAIRAVAILACLFASTAAATDAAFETVLAGLSNPCGVAVRPTDSAERYEVFIADSGAGRVIRIWNTEPTATTDVVTGFELASLGDGGLPVGPIALLFLDRNHLVVGVSGKDGGASVRLYELSDGPSSLSAGEAKQDVRLADQNGDDDAGRHHLYAFARTLANDKVSDALIVTSFANDSSGDVRRIAVRAGTLGKIEPFVAAEKTPPAAIAIGQRGHVVVGGVGSLDEPRDSRLAFYSPLDGSRIMELSTGLYDILGLAYSPKTGNLYAADAAWMDADKGGVFRIDDASKPGKSQCVAVKLADVICPSALAFGPDGALYVTAFGDVDRNDPRRGQLLRIRGDL